MDEDIEERVDPVEMDTTFQLLRKVESRKFIYDSRDPKHSKRDILSAAWEDIASDVKLDGKQVTGDWCKAKWKKVRDYYYRVKKSLKGKSGQGGSKKKNWIYYTTMDRILSNCVEENEYTQSNATEDDDWLSNLDRHQGTDENDTSQESTPSFIESTPETKRQAGSNKCRRRKHENEDDLVNSKILKVLEQADEIHDEYYHFYMAIASKLRKLSTDTADFAMEGISDLLYSINHPSE